MTHSGHRSTARRTDVISDRSQGSPLISVYDNPIQTNSLAEFIIGTVDRLVGIAEKLNKKSAVAQVKLKEIGFSIPFRTEANGSLRIVAQTREQPPVLSLPKARVVLFKKDRQVVFQSAELKKTPANKISRLELVIRI